MLIKNQKWKYSAPLFTADELIERGIDDEDDADGAEIFLSEMKKVTTSMRQGECDEHSGGKRGIYLENEWIVSHNEIFLPHWKEFCDALDQYHNTLNTVPDETITFFELIRIEVSDEVIPMLLKALKGIPFKCLSFCYNQLGREGISMIMDLLKNNKHLKELEIRRTDQIIERADAEEMCELAQNHPSLKNLILHNCCNGYGFDMLCSLLGSCDNLIHIEMCNNGIRTGAVHSFQTV